MPHSPAVVGGLIESAIGRRAHVIDVHEPAPGFLELQMHAAPPPGGWQPGHEIQLRVAPTLGRRYTVRTVTGPDSQHISLLAATDASGPGTTYLQRLRVGDHLRLIAGRHRPLRVSGDRLALLGDGCTLGTLDAYARAVNAAFVTVEVPADAAAPLTERWPRYRFIPAWGKRGEALQSWLDHAIDTDGLGQLDGALLLGHAQSIQRQRHALSATLPRRSITTKPYWATGKHGL